MSKRVATIFKLRNRCAALQWHEKPSKNKPAHRQTPKLPLPRPTPPRLNKIRLNISRCNIQQHLTMHWFDCLVEHCTMTTGALNNAQIDMPSWTLGAIYRMYSKSIQLVYHLFSIDSIIKWLNDSIDTIDAMVCYFCAKLDYQRLFITFWEHKITIYRFNFWKKAKVRRHLYNGTQHCSMFIRELCPLRFSILSQCSRFKILKIRQKLGFQIFCIFFGLKPSPGHGLP